MQDMKIRRIDHVGIVVNDLSAAKAFFLDFGLDVVGEGEVEGDWVDTIVGLHGVKATIVMMRTTDGETNIELSKILPAIGWESRANFLAANIPVNSRAYRFCRGRCWKPSRCQVEKEGRGTIQRYSQL